MKMEAKVQDTIWITDEMDFFAMIEKKLEVQGFEVLETLPPGRQIPDSHSRNRVKQILANRSSNRFAY
jgi:hypothetical protein